MNEITCVLGKRIRFTRERYIHIISRHPEMKGRETAIEETLWNADFVQESIYDRNVLLYYRSIGRNQYMVIVTKILNNHGFIITSYIADVVKKGVIVWKK